MLPRRGTGLMSRRRSPASKCALCGRVLDEVGGVRLIRTLSAGLVRRHIDGPIGPLPGPAQVLPLGGDHRQTMLVVWGLPWPPTACERAIAQAQLGWQPWFCQRCARHVCETCGAPLRRVPGADVLADDGDVLHHPLLPVPVTCTAGHRADRGLGASGG